MLNARTLPGLAEELAAIRGASLWKTERPILTTQNAHIRVGGNRSMLNFCANNYLGLADHPALIEAAKAALDSHGLGMASVRFICGTNDLHQTLEAKIAAYLGMDDCITFAACFDANGAVFEPLFGDKDAIISDSLNHASIIDGIRLSKAARFRYANGDMADLEVQLKAARAANARRVVIVTDGVFSMDGYFADLVSIRALADKYDALIMVDDCHATGFIGPEGAGTPARAGVKVDILTGTLGKALGGSMGGYIAASKDVVALMRQRARPYLFSNALAPAIAAAGTKAIELAEQGDALRATPHLSPGTTCRRHLCQPEPGAAIRHRPARTGGCVGSARQWCAACQGLDAGRAGPRPAVASGQRPLVSHARFIHARLIHAGFNDGPWPAGADWPARQDADGTARITRRVKAASTQTPSRAKSSKSTCRCLTRRW